MIALIAAKGDSERVHRKNLRSFYDRLSLLEIKVAQLTAMDTFKAVVVSSDSATALGIAEKYGAIAHRREKRHCGGERSMSEVYRYLADEMSALFPRDSIAWTPCTNPLVGTETYIRAIGAYAKEVLSGDRDSVLSGTWSGGYDIDQTADGCIHCRFSRDPWARSQDLTRMFRVNFAVCILTHDQLRMWGCLVGKRPYLLGVPKWEGVDIDDMEDFRLCQRLFMGS